MEPTSFPLLFCGGGGRQRSLDASNVDPGRGDLPPRIHAEKIALLGPKLRSSMASRVAADFGPLVVMCCWQFRSGETKRNKSAKEE